MGLLMGAGALGARWGGAGHLRLKRGLRALGGGDARREDPRVGPGSASRDARGGACQPASQPAGA